MSKLDDVLNKNTQAHILAELSSDAETFIRTVVASHPNTSPDTLQALCEDEKIDVLIAIAENQNTPIETLVKLFSHRNRLVHLAIINNPISQTDEFKRLKQIHDIIDI